jgi:hypothetical protein
VPVGVAGELCVRGPQVFAGYWGQPAETASMLRDDWLLTGDVAVMDSAGFVTIVDRKRDVINASGFSVFPSEIEDVLAEHPKVKDSAVVGVSHSYRGETVKAFVVLEPETQVTESELRAFCAARLVAYKVPVLYEFRDELPHNILGKVLRRVLRAEHEAARANRPRPDDTDQLWSTMELAAYGPAPDEVAQYDGDPGPQHDAGATAQHTEELPPRHALTPRPFAPSAPWAPSAASAPAAAGPSGPDAGLVDELERLARLRDLGALTDAEFQAAKSRLLG